MRRVQLLLGKRFRTFRAVENLADLTAWFVTVPISLLALLWVFGVF
jgi:hypothetical protein